MRRAENTNIKMAQRRMFSKSITNSSQFLMMPQSSQNLYFHLGMNADDDGFCEHFALMRMTDSKPDDLKILQAKGFVSVFDDKVLVISDWKENNYLRSDRYSQSKYLVIYKKELKLLAKITNTMDTTGIPEVHQVATQVRLGKDRLGESVAETSSAGTNISEIIKEFETINPSCKKMYGNKTQRQACTDLIEAYGYDRVIAVVSKTLPKTNGMEFFPTITTPLQLFDKWATLEAKVKEHQSKKLKTNNVAF